MFGGPVQAALAALVYDALVNRNVWAAGGLGIIVLVVLGLWLVRDY